MHPIDPLANFLLVISVVDREHWGWVGEGKEAIDWIASDAGGGGVWVVEFGVIGFEGFEFFEELVELGVGHDLGIARVVGGIGAAQEGAEFFDS